MYFKAPDVCSRVYLNGDTIDSVSLFKLLGVFIVSCLNFSHHCIHILKKLNSCLFILHTYRNNLPNSTLKLIFYSIGISHIFYALPSYHDFLRVSDSIAIERKYIKCMRVISSKTLADNRVSSPLAKSSFDGIVYETKLNFILSVLNKKFSPCLISSLTLPTHAYNTRFHVSS